MSNLFHISNNMLLRPYFMNSFLFHAHLKKIFALHKSFFTGRCQGKGRQLSREKISICKKILDLKILFFVQSFFLKKKTSHFLGYETHFAHRLIISGFIWYFLILILFMDYHPPASGFCFHNLQQFQVTS